MKNTFRLSLLIAILLLPLLPAAAQQFLVRGEVRDSATQVPLPLLPVQLITADSALYSLAATDTTGRFEIRTDSAGDYRLRISGLGYSMHERLVRLSASRPSLNIGLVRLQEESTLLSTATVVGKATNLAIRKDTFVYSTRTMQITPGSTMSAVISQMPGVSMDEDGNLVWQGKKVENILINGKKFFGADLKSALQNLPAEMIEKLKLYEKKSDMTERTGIDDGTRNVVMDVGIKKEYQGRWSGNADVGAGYEKKWTGRLFLSRFSDRLQVGLSGLANNLNGDMKADANGNWTNSGYRTGWTTFRNTHLRLAWNSKDDKQATGYQELEAHAGFRHDNSDYRLHTRQENILPGTYGVWWHERERSLHMDEELTGSLNYSANLSSTSFLTVSADINNTRGNTSQDIRSATFHTRPPLEQDNDPLDHVFGDALTDDYRALLTNTLHQQAHYDRHGRNYNASAHLLQKINEKDAVNLSANWSYSKKRLDDFLFYDLIYFTDGESRAPQRQFHPVDDNSHQAGFSANYQKAVAEKSWLSLGYDFGYTRTNGISEYWRLESLPGWDRLDLYPLTALPDSFRNQPQLLDPNSVYSQNTVKSHRVFASFTGNWKTWETYLYASTSYDNERLDYNRHCTLDTIAGRKSSVFSAYGRLKYKFSERTALSFNYNMGMTRPELTSLLPYRDTSNPTTTSIGNPHLKNNIYHTPSLSFNSFHEALQLSLWGNAFLNIRRNPIGRIMTYRPETGYYEYQEINLDRNYMTGGSLGGNMVLDTKKIWSVYYSLNLYHNSQQNYLNVIGEEPQLNEITAFACSNNFGLNYTKNQLKANLSGSITKERNRTRLQPESNHSPLTYSYKLAITYTTPWQMTLSTDFGQWSRRKFIDPYLNTDQFLWNASITQSLLKNKNLMVKLEAVDLLANRENTYSFHSGVAVGLREYNGFERYAVLHLIYQFK